MAGPGLGEDEYLAGQLHLSGTLLVAAVAMMLAPIPVVWFLRAVGLASDSLPFHICFFIAMIAAPIQFMAGSAWYFVTLFRRWLHRA